LDGSSALCHGKAGAGDIRLHAVLVADSIMLFFLPVLQVQGSIEGIALSPPFKRGKFIMIRLLMWSTVYPWALPTGVTTICL